MKNRISTLLLLLIVSHLSFAQVKRQYQDEVFGQTTVVVKQEAATDADVLNELDIDEIGMHQVIRITTEDNPFIAKAENADNKQETNQNLELAKATQVKSEETNFTPIGEASVNQTKSTRFNPQAQELNQTEFNRSNKVQLINQKTTIASSDPRPKARRWSIRKKTKQAKAVSLAKSSHAESTSLEEAAESRNDSELKENSSRKINSKRQGNTTKVERAEKKESIKKSSKKRKRKKLIRSKKKKRKNRKIKKAKRKKFKKKGKYSCFQF